MVQKTTTQKTTTQERLARAVQRAVEHHGVPNQFGLSELEMHHGGPEVEAAGRAARKWPAWGVVAGDVRMRFLYTSARGGRVPQIVATPASEQALVVWLDYTGLPRAYASGPWFELEKIRDRARYQLAAYCAKNDGIEPDLADPAKFTERIGPADGTTEISAFAIAGD